MFHPIAYDPMVNASGTAYSMIDVASKLVKLVVSSA